MYKAYEQKNTFKGIPRFLQALIWEFAYYGNINGDPLQDLWTVSHYQRSIPSIFLSDRMPWNGMSQGFATTEICALNPLRKGNPYIPLSSIDVRATPWSRCFYFAIHLLSKEGVRRMKTYKGHLFRKVHELTNRNVFWWNRICVKLLMYYPGLEDPTNYKTPCSWERDFIFEFTEAISRAQLVSPLAVVSLT